ncbi:hypothetical protein GCK72_020435 [Caenorhabditis remanei]|uniref:Uncharacterized protein n=2 Tax=Caenorhabditis remanei TaxID=31234 RepID=E3LIS4_CAERE|nr:hypothetical protein GCK72_020435 [Caenorhabditis remanei]EFO95098.1 hypothetical protein CRE_09427 [Caenorhabditis remanei]KAF1753878.1 hypothetical protein GCK72_020435 [Caenorhabditis remanei]
MDHINKKDDCLRKECDGKEQKLLGKDCTEFGHIKRDEKMECGKGQCDMKNKCSDEEDLKKRRESDIRNKEM